MAPSPRSASSPLAAYLSEIDQTPLLNADEERTLAGRVQAGDSEARDRMISANLRLVVQIARAFKVTEPMTLAQVGKRLRLTRERVRQIEHDALQKLHELMTPDLLRRE